MGQDRNIVHQYFKRESGDTIILVKVNPIQWKGTEITIHPGAKIQLRDLDFDEGIMEDLEVDGFTESSAMEFNLYYAGLL